MLSTSSMHSGRTGTIALASGDNRRLMDSAGRLDLIRDLCSFRERGPGTDSERRAADMLAGRLRRIGRRAEIEPFFAHPEYAVVHLIHAAMGVAGSILATVQPAAGFALVLLAAISTYLDLNTRLYLVRSLLFRRISQNVVSPGDRPGAPPRLILMAHYDAARTGYIFSKGSKRIRRLPERTRVGLGPFRIFFWLGLAPLLPILGARMAGLDATWLNALQAIPTIVLIVAGFLLIDIALSDIVPGRLRQRLRRGRGPLGRRGAHRQPARESRRLGRPGRLRGVLLRGQPRLRPLPPQGARPGHHRLRECRLGLLRRGRLRDQPGSCDQPPPRPAADRALRGALRGRPERSPPSAIPSSTTPCPPVSAGCARSRSAPPTRTATSPPGTTPTRTSPSEWTPRRSPARPTSSSRSPGCSIARRVPPRRSRPPSERPCKDRPWRRSRPRSD